MMPPIPSHHTVILVADATVEVGGANVLRLPGASARAAPDNTALDRAYAFDLDTLRKPGKAIHLKYYGFSIDNASKKASNCRKTSI